MTLINNCDQLMLLSKCDDKLGFTHNQRQVHMNGIGGQKLKIYKGFKGSQSWGKVVTIVRRIKYINKQTKTKWVSSRAPHDHEPTCKEHAEGWAQNQS